MMKLSFFVVEQLWRPHVAHTVGSCAITGMNCCSDQCTSLCCANNRNRYCPFHAVVQTRCHPSGPRVMLGSRMILPSTCGFRKTPGMLLHW